MSGIWPNLLTTDETEAVARCPGPDRTVPAQHKAINRRVHLAGIRLVRQRDSMMIGRKIRRGMFGFLGLGVKAFNLLARMDATRRATTLLKLGNSGGIPIVGGHELIELWQGPKELIPTRVKTCPRCRTG